jgi:hypothetical protein
MWAGFNDEVGLPDTARPAAPGMRADLPRGYISQLGKPFYCLSQSLSF